MTFFIFAMRFFMTQYLGLQTNASQSSISQVLTTELLHGVQTPLLLCKVMCMILQTIRKSMHFPPFLKDGRSCRLSLPWRNLFTP